MRSDVVIEHRTAYVRLQVHDPHAVVSQPVDTSLEGGRLAHYHGSDLELPDKPAAVPARRESRSHNRVFVRKLPSCVSECVRLRVHRRIALLNSPVVPATEQIPVRIEQRCADWNAAFR